MRTLLSVLAIFVLPLAGCLDGGADSPGTEPTSPSSRPPAALHPEGTPEFCESEEVGIPSGPFASECMFWDEEFHEFVVYDLDTTVIDVVIVPSVGPDAVGMAASRRSVEAWEEGIRAYASPWFNASFEMNIFVVGQDIPSLDAIQDPEIVVVSSGSEGLLGIGLEPKQLGCQLIQEGGEAAFEYPVHSHRGVEVRAADCTGTGFTCFALNFGSSDLRDLYDLIAHEVGHCLGVGHVGDALDFRARFAPIEDIMSYQSNATQVHCVSNLNVRVLEGVYAHLLEQPEEMWLPRGSYYAMSPLDYQRTTCANPS